MKPIIKWRTPDESQFRARLERRLRSAVLRSWNRTRAAIQQKHDHQAQFASLSVSGRLALARHTALLELRRAGFREWVVQGTGDSPSADIASLSRWHPPLVSVSLRQRTFAVAYVMALESVTKTALREIQRDVAILRYRSPSKIIPDSVQIHVVCMSLRPVPASRVESVFDLRPPTRGAICSSWEGRLGWRWA